MRELCRIHLILLISIETLQMDGLMRELCCIHLILLVLLVHMPTLVFLGMQCGCILLVEGVRKLAIQIVRLRYSHLIQTLDW